MSRGPRIDFGQNCTWCGHQRPHPLPCPGTIQTGTAKTPTVRPCPCAKRNQETK